MFDMDTSCPYAKNTHNNILKAVKTFSRHAIAAFKPVSSIDFKNIRANLRILFLPDRMNRNASGLFFTNRSANLKVLQHTLRCSKSPPCSPPHLPPPRERLYIFFISFIFSRFLSWYQLKHYVTNSTEIY